MTPQQAIPSLALHALHLLQAVRHQAAAVLAALALSSPPLLARLFGECLEGVETFCQQLMLLAAPYTKLRSPPMSSVASSGGPGSGNSGVVCLAAVCQLMLCPTASGDYLPACLSNLSKHVKFAAAALPGQYEAAYRCPSNIPGTASTLDR